MVPVGAMTVVCALRNPCVLAEHERSVPAFAGGVEKLTGRERIGVGELAESIADGRDVEILVSAQGHPWAFCALYACAAVIADHPEHVVLVLAVSGEGAELARHLGAGGVALAGEDAGERGADRAPFSLS
jgi:hypothetical protein